MNVTTEKHSEMLYCLCRKQSDLEICRPKLPTFSRPNTTFSPFLAPKIKTGSNQKIKACTNITRTQETLKITSR